MAEEKNAPTKEEVQEANAKEMQKWESDFKPEELAVPYSRDSEEDDKKPEQDDKKPEAGDKDSETDTDAEAAAEKEEEAEEDDEPQVEYTEPEAVVTVEDPGEYEPADYSFKVKNKDGKTVTIKTPEQANEFAEDDDNFTSAKDLKDFLRLSQKMENNLERDKEQYDQKKAQYEEQTKAQAARTETINSIASEFDYLVTKGLLPKIDAKYKNADWSDPEVAKQPGVKEQIALLNYMASENETRAKVGVRPITSAVDAYNAWKLEQNDQDEAEEKRKAGEARRAAGARVAAASSGAPSAGMPKGIAVGNPNVFKRNASIWDD